MDGLNQNNTSHTSHSASASTSTPSSTTGSSRRRLTKKPPSSHQQFAHRSSHSVDAAAVTAGRFDALSLQSKRSSTSLTRAPSAPLARSPTKPNSSNNASNGSSPRHLPTSSAAAVPAGPGNSTLHHHHHNNNNNNNQHQYQYQQQHQKQQSRSLNPSPILSGGEFSTGLSFSSRPPSASANAGRDPGRSRDQYRLSDPHNNNLNYGPGTGTSNHRRLVSRASEEFIGAPFDGSAILNRIEATKSPVLSPTRPSNPRAAYTTPDARTAGLFRHSASFSAAADSMAASEKSQGSKPSDSAKRFSDESKEPKMSSVLRKKSGFSGFMTSLVGSPKKPTISAPENPVHVTHVGYDSSTGQFTVSRLNYLCRQVNWFCPRSLFAFLVLIFSLASLLLGPAQGMATIDQRERHSRKRQAGESPNARRRAYLLQRDDGKASRGSKPGEVP